MMNLRIFNPDGHDGPEQVSASWSVHRFVHDWYLPTMLADQSRRLPDRKTLDKRVVAAHWWTQEMQRPGLPEGPPIGDITTDDLMLFRDRLANAKYKKGKLGQWRPLKPASQFRQQSELHIILSAAGPKSGRKIRAGIIDYVPTIYVEEPAVWPKETWTIDEAKQIVAGLDSYGRIERFGEPVDRYRALAKATLAFWFYTGHRSSTFRRTTLADLVEPRKGQWYLQIARSVKTKKKDRLAVHPQLLQALLNLKSLYRSQPSSPLIPWRMLDRTIFDHHQWWQQHAELTELRQFSPQAWRRLHAAAIAETGYQTARNLAAGSLGHSSASITESHYASIRDAAILSLPNLFGGQADEASVAK